MFQVDPLVDCLSANCTAEECSWLLMSNDLPSNSQLHFKGGNVAHVGAIFHWNLYHWLLKCSTWNLFQIKSFSDLPAPSFFNPPICRLSIPKAANGNKLWDSKESIWVTSAIGSRFWRGSTFEGIFTRAQRPCCTRHGGHNERQWLTNSLRAEKKRNTVHLFLNERIWIFSSWNFENIQFCWSWILRNALSRLPAADYNI